MSRSALLAFACLASFLILLPLALKKPGLPMRLAGDEATYLSMATSLALDGDVRCDEVDRSRLFAEFPFAEGVRLELASDDGWASTRFARPLIYPLVAAPWVALWGANGAIALNAALFVLAVACGWRHLRRPGSDGLALLFSLGFFLFSTTFVYLFRAQPQILIMAMVTVAMTFGWQRPEGERREPTAWHRWWLSGAALGLAILLEPVLALLAVPLFGGLGKARRRAAGSWLAGCAGMLLLGSLLSAAWAGQLWPGRPSGEQPARTFTVDSPLETPWRDPPAGSFTVDTATESADARRSVGDFFEDASLFLWGRRTGILPYFPLIAPLLVIFGAGAPRDRRRWHLLAVLAVLGLLQLIAEPVSRALHEADAGNPHMVGIYPAFLFLITRLRRPAVLASYGLGALVLGPMITMTLGSVVPGAPIHAHTRNFPFTWLPFEVPALGHLSGYREVELYGLESSSDSPTARLWAPADQTQIRGNELWLLGGESVELWLENRSELSSVVLQLRNLASHNRVELRIAGQRIRRDFDQVPPAGISFHLELEPERADRVRRLDSTQAPGRIYYYRLRIETRLGEKPKWRQDTGGRDYLGVALAVLGTREYLGRDLYAVEWLGCGAPAQVAPGEEFLAAARLRNSSDHGWPHPGPARVRLSYRWLAGGLEVATPSERTDLPAPVAPGQDFASWVLVRAPRAPGSYQLEIDPLFENVAWFSSRDPDATCRVDVEVAPR